MQEIKKIFLGDLEDPVSKESLGQGGDDSFCGKSTRETVEH